MGKQSNKPTQVSQEQFNKDLDKSLEILHNDGASDQELIDYTNDYKSRFVVEKKNQIGTVTTPKKSGESVPKGGSLGTAPKKYRLPTEDDFTEMQKQGKLPKESVYSKPKFNEKEVYNLDNKGEVILPSKKQIKKNEDEIISLHNLAGRDFRRATDLELNNFKSATNLSEQEIEEKNKEVNDEININGFWNTAKDYGKKALNVLSSSVARMTDEEGLDKELQISTDPLSNYKQYYIETQESNGIDTSKLTKEEIFYGAKNLLLKEKKDKLKEDKTTLYIDSLSDEEKKALNLTKLFKRENLNEKDKVYLTNTEVSKQELENANSEIKRIISKFKNKEELSETEIEFAKNYEKNSKFLAEDYNKNYLKYQKNNSELGDINQEYDLLKRDYDITRKSLATLGARSAQIIYGLATVSNDLLNSDEDSRTSINDKLSEANSKVNDLLENNYQKNTDDWNGIGDAFEYVIGTISNQLPNIALMGLTGGGSNIVPLLTIGAYSSGNKINELTQSNNDLKTFYTEDQIRKYAYISGAGEMLETGTMGNLVRFNKFMKTSFNNPKTRDLFLETAKESLGKSFKAVNKGLISENAEEIGTMWIDIFAKRQFLGVETSKKEIADLTERTLKDTSTMSLLMSATPQIAHQILKPLIPKSYVKNLDDNTKEILRLNNELKKTDLTKEETDIIKKSLDKKISENKKILENVLDRNKNLDDSQRKKAIELELSTSEIRSEAKSIKKSSTIDKDVKIELLKDLEIEYKKQESLREKIASGESNILDIVSDDEKKQMKANALKVLLNENKGSNEANYTSEVIDKKVIEIHNKEVTERKAKEALDKEPKNIFYYKGDVAPTEIPEGYTTTKKVENSAEVKLFEEQEAKNKKVNSEKEGKNMDEFYKIHAEEYSVTDKASEDFRNDKLTVEEYNSIRKNEESKRENKLNELKDRIGDNEYNIVKKKANINWYENSISGSEQTIKELENKKNPTEEDLNYKKREEEYLERNKQGLAKAKEELESLKSKQKTTETKAKTKESQVEKLRADEQAELKKALPNAELKADGKIDVEKLSLTDAVTYDDIYSKYDKLISPLLEEAKQPTKSEPITEENVVDKKPEVIDLASKINSNEIVHENVSDKFKDLQKLHKVLDLKGGERVKGDNRSNVLNAREKLLSENKGVKYIYDNFDKILEEIGAKKGDC